MRLILSVLFLLFSFSTWAQGSSPFSFGFNKKLQLSCDNVKDIQRGFLLAHILYHDLTPELEKRTVERYIDFLDGSEILFTEKDVAQIKKDMTGVFKELEARKCDKLNKVHKLYSDRIAERAEFAKTVLGKKFKFNKNTRLVLDPDSRDRAKTKKELKQLQRNYLHFQVSNYLLSDETVPKAKEKVKRSYDRIVKKVKDYRTEDMLTNYLNSFSHALDSHTGYFSGDMLEDFEISMKLSLQGIGATLTNDDGFTVVDSLVKGGAAYKSGLVEEKDKIVAVSQYNKKTGKAEAFVDVVEQDLRDVVRLIRGPKGSKVRLKILRQSKGKNSTHLITLVRDKVVLEDDAASISYLEKSNNGVKRKVAVINLPSFYSDSKKGGRSCAKDVAKLIEEAKNEKADAMVLDLSRNGGGSLNDAVDLAGLFFKTGNVVKQSSRNPAMRAQALKDTDPKVNWTKPLVILTSRASASASEIVAGALKDYGRAVIVGADHTFGKGSVQQVIPLAPGLGALKVTIGMFFTPGGYSTQHRGVSSDIVFPSELHSEENEIGEKSLDYSLPPKKIASFVSPTAVVTSGKGKWDKVDSKMVGVLNERSQRRILSEPKFQEIVKEISDKKKETKEILLADSFKDAKEAKAKNEKRKKQSDVEKLAEYLKREDVLESVNIAVDLVDFKNKVPLKVIAATTAKMGEKRDIQSVKSGNSQSQKHKK